MCVCVCVCVCVCNHYLRVRVCVCVCVCALGRGVLTVHAATQVGQCSGPDLKVLLDHPRCV